MSLVRFRPKAPGMSGSHCTDTQARKPPGGMRAAYADLAHLVERHLAKVEVASSSLVIRSKQKPILKQDGLFSVFRSCRNWEPCRNADAVAAFCLIPSMISWASILRKPCQAVTQVPHSGKRAPSRLLRGLKKTRDCGRIEAAARGKLSGSLQGDRGLAKGAVCWRLLPSP